MNRDLRKEMGGLAESLYRRTLHQTAVVVRANYSADPSSKGVQQKTILAAKGGDGNKLVSPKVRPSQVIPKDILERIMNPYSRIPIDSSLAIKVVKGTEYFDEHVRQLYLSCETVIFRDPSSAYGKCRNFTSMRFIDGSRIVALVSFPGSGSTWVRSALEQATGIYTGSIYCDNMLKSKGFVGEKVVSANVLAVKTHYPSMELFPKIQDLHDPDKFKNITAVILLVRNPLDSIVSLWNWFHGGHTATAIPRNFGM